MVFLMDFVKVLIHLLDGAGKKNCWVLWNNFGEAFWCHPIVIRYFWPASHTDFYPYRKCVCPANRSHRNWQAVHIDAGHSFTSTRVNGLLVQLVHIENCTLPARENAPSPGGEGKRKSLDFSRLFLVGGRNRTRIANLLTKSVNITTWCIML